MAENDYTTQDFIDKVLNVGRTVESAGIVHLSHSREFRVGNIVRHFKGDYYRIGAMAMHTETEELLVIYEPVFPSPKPMVYARPLQSFLAEVDKEKYPEATQKYRMEIVSAIGK